MENLYRYMRHIFRSIDDGIDHLFCDLLMDADGLRRENAYKRAIVRVLRQARLGYAMLSGGWRFRLWVMRGSVRGISHPVTLAYFAEARAIGCAGCCDIRDMIFDECEPDIEDRGGLPAWRLPGAARDIAAEADLVVLERNRLLNWLPESGDWFLAPLSVRMRFIFHPGEPWETVERRMKGNNYNIHLYKAANFSVRVTRDEADFNTFYDQMYVPTIRKRYPHKNWMQDRAALRKIYRRGMLLQLVDSDGTAVSAILLHFRGGVVYTEVNGVRDGDQALMNRGAMSGLYYATIRWCYDNQYDQLDMSGCRPLKRDGLFLHKLHWGDQPIPDLWNNYDWLFWCQHDAGDPKNLVNDLASRFLPDFSHCPVCREEKTSRQAQRV